MSEASASRIRSQGAVPQDRGTPEHEVVGRMLARCSDAGFGASITPFWLGVPLGPRSAIREKSDVVSLVNALFSTSVDSRAL